MNIEYSVGLIRVDSESHAAKSHRQKMQNPGLQIGVDGQVVRWTVVGLQPGQVETAEDSDVDHLDIYVFRDAFCDQRHEFPTPTLAPGGGSLAPAYPWGSEGAGKPPIQPGAPDSRFNITRAEMRLPWVPARATTVGQCVLNVDIENAPYPNPSGDNRQQVHFGIEATWRNYRRPKAQEHRCCA